MVKDKIIRLAEKNGASFKDEISERDYIEYKKREQGAIFIAVIIVFAILFSVIASEYDHIFNALNACKAMIPT